MGKGGAAVRGHSTQQQHQRQQPPVSEAGETRHEPRHAVCVCCGSVGRDSRDASALPSVFPALEMSQLEQLRKHTTVVADSGDFHSYSALKGSIQDGTTNPSVRVPLCIVQLCSAVPLLV